jgi:peptidoglycan/xylan/chitin deacetylase (PgdA/CDA1 family)
MKEQAIKLTAGALASTMLPGIMRREKQRKKLVTILCLHRVSDEPSLCWPPLTLYVFERLCRYWAKHYQVTNFSALRDSISQDKPALILSFDDGYLDFYTHAWPLLEKYGLKANMNLVTSSVSFGSPIWTQRLNNAFDVLWNKGIHKTIELPNGSRIEPSMTSAGIIQENLKMFRYLHDIERTQRQAILDEMIKRFHISEIQTPFMNWEQVISLHKEGLELGSHTVTHDALPTIKDRVQLQAELNESKKIIEEKIEAPVNVLAFPNGSYNEGINKLAFEAGYEFLLTVDNALFPAGDITGKTVMPRILIYHTGYNENMLNTENFFTRIKSIIK